MLKIKKIFHFKTPNLFPRRLQLAPIPVDNDELIREINAQQIANDDNWTLRVVPDADELASFWNRVTADVEQDPEWFKFSND